MAIGTAFVLDGIILVYDMAGKQLCWLHKADGLHGFTNTSVSVRHGANMVVYSEHGHKLYSVFCGTPAVSPHPASHGSNASAAMFGGLANNAGTNSSSAGSFSNKGAA